MWSVLFLATAGAGTALFLAAPFRADWWLLPNPSTLTRQVDHLTLLILVITGVVFVITHLALIWAMFRYAARPGGRAIYSHGNARVELIWTLIPGAILLFLAVYQTGAWASLKFRSGEPDVPITAEVTGRQFQWLMRYPGPDGRLGTDDDLHTVNDLRIVKGEPALIRLRSNDVIHSFFLPQLRIKQDAVPGLTIPVWFDSDRATDPERPIELVCAELCGWGHSRMRATVTVYATRDEFNAWQAEALAAQSADQLAPTATADTSASPAEEGRP
jgi:cytochrome c oxidase subunit 2